MGMQICRELDLFPHIGFDQSFAEGILILLCLAHQGLGNGRNDRIDFDLAIGINIGQLGAVETKNINPLTVTLDIAGNLAFDDGFSIPHRSELTGNRRQIIDQIIRLMIFNMNGIGKDRLVHA